MEIEVQILKPNDGGKFNELISIFEIVFEMESFRRPGASHIQQLLHKENFFAVIAMTGRKMIGGLTVYVLDQYYSEKPIAYIYDLAVLPDYQRMGVGKALVAFTNEYCRENGFEEVFVQAEKTDIHALEFYRATKATNEEEAIHFSYEL